MASANPLISVIIPAYNYAKTLPRAVDSVCKQITNNTVELIVIDDGSTDDTRTVIESLGEKYPGKFKALRQDNKGLSAVRNRGIREAHGQFFVFLDADDELAPEALTMLAKHIESHPQTRMVIGGHYSISENGKRREHIPTALPTHPLQRLKAYLFSKQISLSNGACAMHREVFSRGDYPENFRSAEDIPVFCQTLVNFPCTILPKPIAIIHKHSDSLRHQFAHAQKGGLALVDEVFSTQRIGSELQTLKDAYYVQRCLSLFRSAYLANDADAAKAYFLAALSKDWRVLLNSSYIRKAIRLWLKNKT